MLGLDRGPPYTKPRNVTFQDQPVDILLREARKSTGQPKPIYAEVSRGFLNSIMLTNMCSADNLSLIRLHIPFHVYLGLFDIYFHEAL